MFAPIDDYAVTFKTRREAINAFHAVYPPGLIINFIWTVVATPDGEFFPLCIGQPAVNEKSYLHFATAV